LKNIKGFVPLKVDGDYGVKTISAIKLYWQQIGWSENGCDGTKVGMKTITALASGKTK
jgi:peptidoglycan hydrolase-like protein with peptidoglycan-binding domain